MANRLKLPLIMSRNPSPLTRHPQNLFAGELSRLDTALGQALSRLPEPVGPIARYSVLNPGKRLRPLICITIAQGFGYDDETLPRLAAALEIMHCASLIHDDILDNAAQRRNAPAAHCRFDRELALLAGDAMFALASRLVASFNQPELSRVFSSAIEQTVAGQALEYASLYLPQPSWDRYWQIIAGKTAALFEAAAWSGALLAGAGEQAASLAAAFGRNLGLGFQLRDDLLDFSGGGKTGKPLGRDVLEGKLTAPVLAWLDNCAPRCAETFLRKFAQKKLDETDLQELSAAVNRPDGQVLGRLKACPCWNNAAQNLKSLPTGLFMGKLHSVLESISYLDNLSHGPDLACAKSSKSA